MTDSTQTILEERARLFARPLETPEPANTIDVLFFTVGDERLAIETGIVQRIAHAPQITRIPGTPPYFAGLAHMRGRLFPVADLALLLGFAAPGELHQLIILGHAHYDIGILATTVSETATIAVAAATGRSSRPLVREVLADGRSLLDGAALLDDPRLVIGAREEPRNPQESTQ